MHKTKAKNELGIAIFDKKDREKHNIIFQDDII